jgi:hypothetical protein
MRVFFVAGILILWKCLAQQPPQPDPPGASTTVTVPAGTKVVLGVTSPIWARSAQPGETIYTETTFPVAVNGAIAIPPGAYVKGTIDIVFRASPRSDRAEFRLSFAQIVFANGYTTALPGAVATVTVQVAALSDVLLDNGTQFDMVLEQPLALDAASIAAAVRMSRPPKPWDWKSASLCRPIPATPGTADTYIPGTPGTPSTSIPGGPGMPSITIPGTPGTPGTLIHGSPGSPGVACPGPPAVSSVPAAHKEPFVLEHPVLLSGQTLPAGTYEATWEGLGPVAEVRILRRGKPVAAVQTTVVALGKDAPANDTAWRTNPDGSFALDLLQFKGRNFALRFGP